LIIYKSLLQPKVCKVFVYSHHIKGAWTYRNIVGASHSLDILAIFACCILPMNENPINSLLQEYADRTVSYHYSSILFVLL